MKRRNNPNQISVMICIFFLIVCLGILLFPNIRANTIDSDLVHTEKATQVSELIVSTTELKKNEECTSEIVETEQQSTEQRVEKKKYSDEDLFILTHVIYGESSGCTFDFQIMVGSVVLNRVNSSDFPNSIKEVVFQKRQYACTWDGNYDKIPDEQAEAVAKYLLENGSQIPEEVVYQAEFEQGDGIWKQVGNTYFCY